jgi:hypothetical protein
MLEKATYGFVEPTNAQLIALFEAWLHDIDSEPFAYENEWAALDSAHYRAFSAHVRHRQGAAPQALPGGPASA